MNARNIVVGAVIAAVVAGVVVSCGGGSGGGGSSSPPVMSGTGRGALVVDTSTGAVTGSVFFSGMSGTPTSVGIFQGDAGQNANPNTPIITMNVTSSGATVPAGSSLTTGASSQVTALQANGLYFLVKTSTFPNGELRGQINNTSGMTAGLGSLDNTQEVPPSVSTATGSGMVVVNSTTGDIIAGVVTYTGLTSNAILTHIHQGAVGANGDIKVNYSPANATAGTATVTDPSTPMTSQDLTDLGAGNLYFNVHSGNYTGGEIRGQIATTTTQDVRSASLDTVQVVP
jgi:hypothetical protein